MELVKEGVALDVFVAQEGRESWAVAEQHVPPNKEACKAQLRARLARLADHGGLRNPDLMNSEGYGIHAVKTTCGLRAYGWFGSGCTGKKAFIIGLVVMKKTQKAKASDLDRVKQTRDRLRG